MKQFDFIEYSILNGYGKMEIPNNIMQLILKFENHVNSEVKKLYIHEVVGQSEQFTCKHF